jgi:hypothetical protein
MTEPYQARISLEPIDRVKDCHPDTAVVPNTWKSLKHQLAKNNLFSPPSKSIKSAPELWDRHPDNCQSLNNRHYFVPIRLTRLAQ